MLTKEEQEFVAYWEQNRLKRKRFLKQLAIGLPFGCIFAAAVFINIVSGWHVASSILRSYSSMILVIMIAVLGIVVFIAVYTAKHRWDINEQRYKELGGKPNETTS